MTATNARLLGGETFSAHGERADTVLAEALERIPPEAAWRVLDIGCGTASMLLTLAAERPRIEVVGTDIAQGSVEIARREARARGLSERARFVVGDYAGLRLDGEFDLVVADQVLHLVGGSTGELMSRLASNLRPGRQLLVEMPYRSAYNSALVAGRRMLRAIRGPRLDALALRVARRAHPDMPAEQLRERIVYLYVVPERLGGAEFDAAAAAHGLLLVSRRRMRHASPAQLRHELSVYRKAG